MPLSSRWENKPCGKTVQYVWLDKTVRGCGGVSRRWGVKNCGGGGWLWQSKNRSQVTCSWSGAGGWREKTEKGEPDGARLEGEGERWENIPSHGGRRKNELQDRGRIKRETAELRDLPTLESINCVFLSRYPVLFLSTRLLYTNAEHTDRAFPDCNFPTSQLSRCWVPIT